jgi:hypothetical protein
MHQELTPCVLNIAATEDSIRVLQSLNGLLLLLRHKDIGLKLFEMRESLRKEVQQLQVRHAHLLINVVANQVFRPQVHGHGP